MQGASGEMASSSIQSSDFFSVLHPKVRKIKMAIGLGRCLISNNMDGVPKHE